MRPAREQRFAFVPERREAIVQDCERNIAEIVQRARRLPAKVVLVTIFPPGPVSLARRPFWSDDVRRAVEEVNRHLEALSGADVQLVDSASVLTVEGRTRADYSVDFLHLNEAGYRAMNAALVPALERLLPP